jgi:hypothetical protein
MAPSSLRVPLRLLKKLQVLVSGSRRRLRQEDPRSGWRLGMLWRRRRRMAFQLLTTRWTKMFSKRMWVMNMLRWRRRRK